MLKQSLPLLASITLLALSACAAAPTADASTEISGVDFCAEYPQPVAAPFELPGGSFAIGEFDHVRGPEDALITVIVFNDYSCPHCAALNSALDDFLAVHPDVRVVYRPYPILSQNSFLVAQAAESVAEQAGEEAFQAFHEQLYQDQDAWFSMDAEQIRAQLSSYADQAGADGEQVLADLDAATYEQRILEWASPLAQNNVTDVPVLLFNDIPMAPAPASLAELEALYGVSLSGRLYHELPPMVIDPDKDYRAWIETDQGVIVAELYADIAPQTVNNFAYLACTGYYEDLHWHRVIEGFVAQVGDPSGTGMGGPSYGVPDENRTADYLARGLSFDRAGLLSMAKSSAPNSAGGQFFITLGPTEHLDPDFTIFGSVLLGQEVVEALERYQADGLLVDPDAGSQLISITVRAVE